jgi:hypothetical protein
VVIITTQKAKKASLPPQPDKRPSSEAEPAVRRS